MYFKGLLVPLRQRKLGEKFSSISGCVLPTIEQALYKKEGKILKNLPKAIDRFFFNMLSKTAPGESSKF